MDKRKEKYLNTAVKIGNRLVDSAVWDGEACTWMVNTPDREKSKERISKKELAGSAFYQGTAGIALFLSALYKFDRNESYLRTAEGALNFSIKDVKSFPASSFGFHSGRPGLAFTLARFAEYCNKKEYLQKAKEILEPLHGNEKEDRGVDVIGGAGGAIQILLKLAKTLNDSSLVDMSEKLAENLVKNARKEAYGWGWGDSSPTHVKCLCGYAHGTAGIGQAFLELYNYTGKNKYLYAADQAFRYERQHYSKENNNWPDFRHTEIGEFYFAGQFDELKELAKADKIEKYESKFMNAWCHGAPGIALSRLRAYELIKNDIYKEETLEALKQTYLSVSTGGGNYSMCHGQGGNCEPFIMATELLGDEKYIQLAEDCLSSGIEAIEEKDKPWPCGTLQGINDPSFMLGEAGIGYFLLRLVDNNLESVLQPVVERAYEKETNDYQEYQKLYVDEFFGDTISLLIKHNLADEKDFTVLHDLDAESSDIEIFRKKIETLVEKLGSEFVFVKDVFAMELDKLEMRNSIVDFTEEYIEGLKRVSIEADFDAEMKFRLSEKNEIIELDFDLDELLKSENLSKNTDTEEAGKFYYILYQQSNKVFRKNLNDFAAIIFDYLKAAKNINEIMDYLKDVFEVVSPEQLKQVETVVRDQILQAYNSGILTLETNTAEKEKENHKLEKAK